MPNRVSKPARSPLSEAMRRRAVVAEEVQGAEPSLWQRAVNYFRPEPVAEADPQAGAQAIHDQVLPEALQITEALEAQRRKKAMLDAMLRSAE